MLLLPLYIDYIYVYDLDNDTLEFYAAKRYEDYDNKDNKKELLLDDKDINFRFVNTFTFTRNSKLRKYVELFDYWQIVEAAYIDEVITDGYK